MALDLPYFRPGAKFREELTAERLNKMVAAIRSLEIQPGTNVRVSRTPGGTTLKASIPRPKGAAGATTGPWNLLLSPSTNPLNTDATILPGTLNGILPSNWNHVFTISKTGIFYAKAVITTDGKNISGVEIAIDGSAPTAQEAQEFAIETNIEYLFGVIADGVAHRVISQGHIEMYTYMWLLATADAPVAAGESPYKIYYLLQ